MARRYLVLHGWENHRPPDHWQFWLTERLRERGCLLWLRHAARASDDQVVDRLLLVCPPSTSTLPTSLATFFPEPGDAAALARSVRRRPELVCTGGDPWCPEGAATAYGERLGLDVHVVDGGGHLSADDGYGPWPEIEQWALTGTFSAETALAA